MIFEIEDIQSTLTEDMILFLATSMSYDEEILKLYINSQNDNYYNCFGRIDKVEGMRVGNGHFSFTCIMTDGSKHTFDGGSMKDFEDWKNKYINREKKLRRLIYGTKS